MSRGLGDCQSYVFGYVRVYSRDFGHVYQSVLYRHGKQAGYSKAAISRAIRTLEGRGLIARSGKGQSVQIVPVSSRPGATGKAKVNT